MEDVPNVPSSFTPSIVRDRLGLVLPEEKMIVSICIGEACVGCDRYIGADAGKGKCSSCGCDMIDHTSFSDDEYEYNNEDFESQYGGGENW